MIKAFFTALPALLVSHLAIASCGIEALDIEGECPRDDSPIFVMSVPGDIIFPDNGTMGSTSGDEDGGGNDCRLECPPEGELPPPIFECVQTGRQLQCMIWPQGEGLSYFWSHAPGLSLLQPMSGPSPTQIIDCGTSANDSHVWIFIQSAQGLQSRGTRMIQCSGEITLVAPVEDTIPPGIPGPTPPSDPLM